MSLKLDKAKTQLVLHHPFFGSLLLGCNITEDNSIETAATDGKDIVYNSKFLESLKAEEISGLLAHEVSHKMFMHVARKYERDHMIWNVAGDFVINLILKDAGLILPAGALYDKQFEDMNADEVYAIIENKVQKHKDENPGDEHRKAVKSAINGEDIPDHLLEGKPMSAAERSELEADIKTEVAQAASIARQRGLLPDSIKKLVNEVLKPKVDWKRILRDFILETLSGDLTYQRPDRHMLAHDLYMPSESGMEMPPFALVFDTSGSIYSAQNTVNTFVAEINGIIEECSPAEVVVVYADSNVCHSQELEQDEILLPELKGGGGTAFSNSFQWLEEHETAFAGIIYFTDLFVSDFGDTDTPVLWAVHGNSNPQTPPFGQIVLIED